MNESEIRKYACCTANLKAATVFSIISIILDVVALVLAIIFISVPAWNNSDHLDWDFVCCTNPWWLILTLGMACVFQLLAYAVISVGWGLIIFLPPLTGIFLIVKDSKVLYGSTKPCRGALIAGAIMEGITLLGLLGIGIFFIVQSPDPIMISIMIPIPSMFIAFKLWNLLIIIGAIQEVELIGQREETAFEMSYVTVAQNESQANKDAN